MYQTLIYNSIQYENFVINECGCIKNLKTNHLYKMSVNKGGYYVVYLPLGKRGAVKCVRVHKAVAETFLPNPNNYPIVHHKDENKLNPHLDNLEWVTAKQNTQYHLQELSKQLDYYNNRKLTYGDVSIIRNIEYMFSRKELGDVFGVSKTVIINVCKLYSYTDI